MTRLRLLLFSAFSITLSSCSSDYPMPSANDPLIGCWAGADYQPALRTTAKWLMNRKADGTFTIEFSGTGDVPLSQIEEGRWTHVENIYRTKTLRVSGRPVDSNDPLYTDTYEVRTIADGVMTYYHSRMNVTFMSRKVACNSAA